MKWQFWLKPKIETTLAQNLEVKTEIEATEIDNSEIPSALSTEVENEEINAAVTQVEPEKDNKVAKQTQETSKPKFASQLAKKSAIFSIDKFYRQKWIYAVVGFWSLFGAMATLGNWRWVQWSELQSHGWFFTLRGSIAAPQDIIILAIDDQSLQDGETYLEQPQKVPYFEPIQRWPWKREVYGIVAQKLLDSGAKVVALDLIFDKPSVYGTTDDQALIKVINNNPGKIVLAAFYEASDTKKGTIDRLIKPNLFIQNNNAKIGTINYYVEPDGRIHRFGDQFLSLTNQSLPKNWQITPDLLEFMGLADIKSFDHAIIEATGIKELKHQRDYIYYYGGAGTFPQFPFSYVIDPENWHSSLESGRIFKDKIVIIGGTDKASQDYHATPTSNDMSGVEIHAHAIASLLQGKSIAQAIPNTVARGIFVLISLSILGLGLGLRKNWLNRMLISGVIVVIWTGISYIVFIHNQLIIPTTIPIMMLLVSGFSTATLGGIQELRNKFQLRQKFKHYVSSPIIQEIIKGQQDEDFEDLITEAEKEVLEKKLGGRYKLISKLAAGGFGQTYIAEDTQKPGNPKCVVKKLAPASNNPKHWDLAKRLFKLEAETLEKLGKHPQIPELFAYIVEEEEFYLVQEFIIGEPLQDELPYFVPLSEPKVVILLAEILEILQFVHSQGVIHRDLKPENIIRRNSDNKLVLIDFGVVKEIETQMLDPEKANKFTIAIGTQGFTPPEQAKGSPRFNSDVYAAGMIAVKALTLQHPATLDENKETGEVIWEDKAKVSPELAAIINKMICANFRERYQSATEALNALQPLLEKALTLTQESTNIQKNEDTEDNNTDFLNPTLPWSNISDIDDNTKPWLDTNIQAQFTSNLEQDDQTKFSLDSDTQAQFTGTLEQDDYTIPLSDFRDDNTEIND